MRPAMYSGARSGSIRPAKMWLKNRTARAAIVKGLISQLTTSVMTSPFGFCPTALSEPKSIAIIIG
jgi:hypothetical protein